MYASGTAVSAERTKAEIELTLRRYGATQFVTGWDKGKNRVMVGFRVADRDVKFVLMLVIKAKLESVEGGIETIEEAFLPQIVLPGGRTVGDWAQVEIPKAYEMGKMPGSLLLLN